MNINILEKMNKVPGGLIIIPLLVAILINTFAPQVLSIGGPTTALFKVGSSAMMGIFLLICGTLINIRQAGLPLYKGAVLLFLKCLAGALAVWVAGTLFGPSGFLGISTLALIACLTSSNSSLYIALCSNYGDASDAGAISVFCIKDGPFVTMMVLGVSGLANIPFAALLSMLIPLLIGMLWGNLDERFKQLCAAAQPLVIIIMSFAIGANSSINTVFTAGLSGILLGIISALTGIVFYFIYNLFLKKKSALGAALGTTAASSALTPAMVAQADHSLAMYVDAATAQLATASIITMITAPILVAWFDKRLKKRAPAAEPLKEVKSEESVTLSSPAAKGHK
ncbi:2-keto-3-deoxygluconate permease [Klebsiella pneumoniae]|uniref:2-keto-3-deoxygluconate permease n=1 Tax=Klebsiella pneumoniae TaxID=573 RepID=UPI001EDA35BC|nr:2-keto-3-deoxygluconate permease [Klebsiella pneumoniae]MBZ7551683.1 2-keto-3-deoxygluconate permease [Klebsiella pneumoniae]MCI8227564.1 2-keto-3-deoxygluconate permease [Klebsiella pneumoniae]MDM8694525.1 2-keto-3-deoxygluconate permease [Klebsiella pneumoniae]MDS0503119.1 2-keto-3-deoxygluconate permease [Klebsiella pneumoniae]UKL48604.1 2-keto-3-deoxygluconate permease [Klebsiella pneumoniae]